MKNKKIHEDIFLNKNSALGMRLVKINYSGKWLPAIEIGYAAGPFYKTSYMFLDNNVIDLEDFADSKKTMMNMYKN